MKAAKTTISIEKLAKIHPLLTWFLIVTSILFIGIFGFMIIEKLSFFDAAYMTVITITTIGYFEIKPLSATGRLFNIFYILTSFTTFTVSFALLTRYVASGHMLFYFKKRKIMNRLAKMNNHVIVCGFGRNGQQVTQTLINHKIPFVVVEVNEKPIEQYVHNYPDLCYLIGDATKDETLLQAGVHQARSLICTLPTDADNLFIVLSVRSLNPNITIISRASYPSSIQKLHIAGANNIIMPERIAGTHMANLVSKPDVIEFLDYLSGEEGESINIESVPFSALHVSIQNTTLKEVMAWKKTGLTCIGLKDAAGKFMINPSEHTIITEGMKVFVLGTRNQIQLMKQNLDWKE